MVEDAGTILLVTPHLSTPVRWRLTRHLIKALRFIPPGPPLPATTGVGTTTQRTDLAQFGQWLIEQLSQLVRDVLGQ